MKDDRITKADSVALWHAVDDSKHMLRGMQDSARNEQEAALFARHIEEQKERIKDASRALRKVQAYVRDHKRRVEQEHLMHKLKNIGDQFANLAYNWRQDTERFKPHEAQTLTSLQAQWDTVSRALAQRQQESK